MLQTARKTSKLWHCFASVLMGFGRGLWPKQGGTRQTFAAYEVNTKQKGRMEQRLKGNQLWNTVHQTTDRPAIDSRRLRSTFSFSLALQDTGFLVLPSSQLIHRVESTNNGANTRIHMAFRRTIVFSEQRATTSKYLFDQTDESTRESLQWGAWQGQAVNDRTIRRLPTMNGMFYTFHKIAT